ncbi:MAG: DUF547 domain-containing protein [Bacteroidota bacterium]
MKKFVLLIAFVSLQLIAALADAPISKAFFDRTDQFMKTNVRNGLVDYSGLKKDATLNELTKTIATARIAHLDDNTRQAFLINAYNLLVIKGAADAYPLVSVLDINGFFDTQKRMVAGRKITLNELEKKLLLKEFDDPRFHFVLVCGAVGCPPITNFAYHPNQLDQQLDTQTRKALNDDNFIRVNQAQQRVELSQIFEWYAEDFGGNKRTAIEFINRYRINKIPVDYKSNFYNYDWSLNTQNADDSNAAETLNTTVGSAANAARYVVSSTIPKGGTETKIFNNLYTQRTGADVGVRTDRSTFFTTSLSFLYGVQERFNAGFDLRYRRVSYDGLPSNPFSVLGAAERANNRSGFTNIGPKIRWAPFERLGNFSVQSAFWIPIGSDLAGSDTQPYIDWNGATSFTQLFNDFSLGSNFSVFTELDIILEDIGNLNRFSTPVTSIFSYFPNSKTTLYALGSFSPFWQSDFDYFAQAGLGAKYQFTPKLELELLYTGFTNQFLQRIDGSATTYNLGFRFNL